MDVNAFAGVVTAAATIITIMVAIWQFKKTISNEEIRRKEALLREKKQNAYLVDAWVVVDREDCNHRHIVIQNSSNGAIRDVSLEIEWGSHDKKEVVPKFGRGWRLLPQGKWLIRKKSTTEEGYPWDFPTPLKHDDMRYEPQFTEKQSYNVCALSFTDAWSNTWRRTYEDCDSCEDNLSLINSVNN